MLENLRPITLKIENMQKPTFDPGLTQQFNGELRRAINKDGRFNVRRNGTTWRDVHPYLHLINMNWPGFLAVLFMAFFVVNTLFAAGYYVLGANELHGTVAPDVGGIFLNDFFFSAQTLTTVGYGSVWPQGLGANVLAAFEAMCGLMGFALATSLLYGRMSRPSARISYSPKMAIAPYMDGLSLQFRIVNRRANSIMELEAKVLLMNVEGPPGELKRTYKPLKLERDNILFFPLTWTIVHPIDQDSPLYGNTAEDLERLQAEVLILIKGYDDTFSQTVHSRYSYRHDEIVWGARFMPAFRINPEGAILLEVDKVGEFIPL
jgi:inward rectifier potassium channel